MLSAGFLPVSPSSAQPDYMHDACLLLLLNSPNGRNRTAQDRVTVRAKDITAVRDDVPRKELPQVKHCSLRGVRSGPILLVPNVVAGNFPTFLCNEQM